MFRWNKLRNYLVLNVENIVVCGHLNCGRCYSALHKENLENIPHVKKMD